ncbi:MAG: hypothetical protein BMS9Abin29_2369 [Gemmatimonadota bacterium]|nr:MAG: hypothetical protein BMS9Abin29_2369 [Gemmatimonadota bacterium]
MFYLSTMRQPTRTRTFHLSLAGVLTLSAVLGGCEDSASDPLGVVVSAETQGALLLVLDRSGLPGLVAESGRADDLRDVSEKWEASWDMTLAAARAARAEVYVQAAPAIAESLGLEALIVATDEVGDALSIIDGLTPDDLAPSIEQRVELATTAHRRARAALDVGATQTAVRALLEASDALREVTPSRLATLLRAIAEDALGRIGDRETYPEETLRRAERLAKGAGSAIDAGDYTTAIRRAYYAALLLGAELP